MLALRRIAELVGAAGLLVALTASLQAQAPQFAAPQATPQPISGAVALRLLPRGTVLQAADVGGDSSASVLGYETQRIIAVGETLRAPAIAPAAIVRSGDAVSVRVDVDGISVSRRGIALGNARLGQPVRVRFGLHSLSGIATAPGVVRLP
jgi:flagella basal body P-ring formation protein FlgA